MVEFMINEPQHKRWMLPDGKHYYNCVLHGSYFHVTIWRQGKFGALDDLVVSCPSVYLDGEGEWKHILELTQELAEKKFRGTSKQVQHNTDYMKSWRL